MGEGTDWEVVFRTGDQVEVELIRGLLVTSEIPVVIENKGFKSMQTFLGATALGEYLVKVPPDLADLARQLLAAEVLEEDKTKE